MAEFSARISNVRMRDAAPSNVHSIFRDGLTNAITGAGTTTDSRSYNFYTHRRLAPQQIEAAYRGGWVMRRIIDKPAREMVREWRNWEATPDDVTAMEKAERKLGIPQQVEKAEQLAGLGGAGMVLWIKGDDPTKPLDPTRIKQGDLGKVVVWHRSRFSLGPKITDPDSEWFEQPSYFQLNTRTTDVQIHPSRVIAFKGQPVPDIVTASWEEAFWGDSTVEVVLDAVANCDTAQNGFAALIKDARNRRVYVPKLLEKTSTSTGEAQLAKRMAAMALGESMFGVTWLDAGATNDDKAGERIDDRQMTWTGMPQMADMYMTAAAGAADMPATVLWGKSPDGMNATGESDKDIWEQTIKGRQDLDLRPCLNQLDAVLIPHATGKQADAEGDDAIGWEFRPLSVMSEPEAAKAFWDFMQGFSLLVNSGTLPSIALEKMIQNKAIETRWFPGTDAVLAELSEQERFPSLAAPEMDATGQPIDPNALTQSSTSGKEADPNLAGRAGDPPVARRRAANDARFRDGAESKTLYIERKLLNAADVIRWAKSQGIKATLAPDDMHVTVAYSRTPVDWFSVGTDWSSDSNGNLLVKPGGPREVRRLGEGDAVALLFASDDLTWRHNAIGEAGASWDWPEYRPHVTITWDAPDLDVSTIEPYTGPLKFGPELFSEVKEGWASDITEE